MAAQHEKKDGYNELQNNVVSSQTIMHNMHTQWSMPTPAVGETMNSHFGRAA